MTDTTQAVEPTKAVAGQEPTTAKTDTTTTPGAQDGDTDKEQPQTGAAAKVSDLPEWAQKEIASLRKEAADRRKAATDAEIAAKAAEEQSLATQQKWEELAKKRGGELDALKPQVELATKLSEMVLAQYEAAIKDWPAEVLAMAPGDDATILAKLEWMDKAKATVARLTGEVAPIPGNGRGPRPTGNAQTAQASKQREQWQKQAAQRYR